MKFISIIGTRPQFIKAASITKSLNDMKIENSIIETGQHYDFNMSDIFLDEFKMPKPRYRLNIGSESHGIQTGRMMIKIDPILIKEKPSAVIVYGDTNSTLAAALSSSKLNIPVIHIEAGLRSYDKSSPEEINRVIVDNISDVCFCPSKYSKANLKNEGIKENVFIVGDVMYDIFKSNSGKFSIKTNYNDYVLLTLHRPANTEPRVLQSRFNQLSLIREKIIYPIHPRTRKIIKEYNIQIPKTVTMIDPIGWFELMDLVKGARFIITDSGGLQKEAFWMKKFCFTIRENTEWIETVDQGVNFLIKDCDVKIEIDKLKNGNFSNPYGDGNASKNIVKKIQQLF